MTTKTPTLSISHFIATWGFLGYLPKMPGTWGSLGALVVACILHAIDTPPDVFLYSTFGIFIIGMGVTIHILKKSPHLKDPSFIVIDEVAGQWIAIIPLWHMALYTWILGFILFRLFDIWKPWPVSYIDQRSYATPFGKAWGVMGDDVVAGVIAALILTGIAVLL